ncbi:hypothetical protein [Flavobacterium aestuarii]|uniref:hypothetical protein n=1 Tax=Flavobacterium aestuarii TaxID=3149227 RepID=UPI0032B36C33
MKKISVSFLLAIFVAISIVGCSSESDDEQNTQDSTGDYWPTAVNNNWVYTQDGDEALIKITEIDDIDGGKYYKFNELEIFGDAVDGQASGWIKKNKGDYYIKIGEVNTTIDGVTAKITGYEFLLFKDYLNVNDTWEGYYTFIQNVSIPDFPVLTAKINYSGKILEKGISLTVKGKVYNDVIKFRFSQSLKGNDAWPSWDYSTDYWIAKNVGIIKYENDEVTSELKSYVIK